MINSVNNIFLDMSDSDVNASIKVTKRGCGDFFG